MKPRAGPSLDNLGSLFQRAVSLLRNRSLRRRAKTLRHQFSLGLEGSPQYIHLAGEEYVEKAARHVEEYGKNAIQFKYEDLLLNPRGHIEQLLDFCGFGNKPVPNGLIESVKPERAYSYRQKPELVEFAERWQKTLAQYGY